MQASDTDIAIVGMAGRFAGARNVEQFWRLVRDGLASPTVRTPEELLAAGVPPELVHDPDYVPVAAMLEDVDCFDAGFFDIGPRDAAIMDPQHRHFLECAWEALEHAGHVPEGFDGSIGVYAGCGMNGYMLHNLLTNPDLVASVGMFLLRHTANDKDFLATGVSYRFNLAGPSVNVQTACSTSLVAIHLAVQGLLNGECDMALAGGATIEVPHGQGYLYREGEILAPDGICRAFDAASTGTVFGSGAGVVVLRRLRDALAEGDTIHAVIKGSAINNDGSRKVGYLAPSVEGHAAVIAEALAIAGVPADSIQFFEAHGTGTAVGDPIEVAAATEAYRGSTERTGFCRLGSSKPNIGHTDTAAGVASVIKVVDALRHRLLPPMANFTAPNPLIDLGASPFYLSGESSVWPTNGGAPRRAGVSSLGVGGTNAHLILEEAPEPPPSDPARPWQLLTLSAKTPEALDRATANLAGHLAANEDLNLADVAFTLQSGRRRFPHRRIVAVRDREDAVSALTSDDGKRLISAHESGGEPSVVFMFPGGGAQYPNMGRELYESEPVYRTEVDRCLALLAPDLGRRVRALLFPAAAGYAEAVERLVMPSVQLPAIFITEYALARLWISWGVRPEAMTGHSLGEYAAACLAGVMSLKDALEIVALRGAIMERVPDAAMLSIPLPEAEIRPLLGDGLSLAAVNGPALCVVSGAAAAIDDLEARLRAREIESRRLKIVGAVHCSLLDPYLDEFGARLAAVRLHPPTLPYISNVTGTWVRPEDAQDPAYWVRHLRHTVRFSDGLGELLSQPNRVLIEVGPGTTLSALARQQPAKPRAAIPSLPHPQEAVSDSGFLLTSVGRAWLAGVAIDWRAFHGGRRRRVPLPAYPFERQRHWIEPGRGTTGGAALTKAADIGEWFYRPVWKRLDLAATPDRATPARWLIFEDAAGVGAHLAGRLRAAGHDVVTVAPGRHFTRSGTDSFLLDPEERPGYDRLIAALAAESRLPERIVHLWPVALPGAGRSPLERAEEAQRRGFLSLLFLAQAIGAQDAELPLQLYAVTAGGRRVDGEADGDPAAALVLGPVRVIPRELANVRCRSIDVDLPAPRSRVRRAVQAATLAARAEALLEEVLSESDATDVALRDGRRWVQEFERVALPEADTSRPVLREGGVYLITGGLGGIGLTLADDLARTYRAKLILLARSALPEGAAWQAWLDTHDDDDPTARRIRALQAIESHGAEVVVVAADVCDPEAMRRVRRDAERRFGALHGIFHAAGVLDDGLIQLKSAESAAAVLAPKVRGTLVIEETFRDAALDFLVLFSSTSALLGLEGQVDYTAANAFLNAFAETRARGGPPYVVAVDWGAWHDTGMTARGDGGTETPRRGGAGSAVHPLPGDAAAEGRAYTARLRPAAAWVLDEHRLKDGSPVMPGTGYLEMLRAAAVQTGASAVELRDVFFIAPLAVADDGEAEVRVTLTPVADGYQAAVTARPANAEAAAGWQDHATAEIRTLRSAAPAPADIAAIERRTAPPDAGRSPEEAGGPQARHLNFGPRWHCLRQTRFGDGEALARLELDAAFHGDLDGSALHPALLDQATGFALPLLAGYDGGALYMPMAYGRLRAYAPLGPRIVSHARLRAPANARSEVVSFDVTITDESGAVLVEVEQFSLRRTDGTAALAAARRLPAETRVADAPSARVSTGQATRLPPGFPAAIQPREGVEALHRILAGGRLAQVAVSPVDLPALIARSGRAREQEASAARVTVARPGAQGDYVAPRDDVETMLAEAWSSLLGVEGAGIDDDFFDLGGHSLIAVRLLNRVKKAFGVELGLAVLFEAPTIARLARVIRAEAGLPSPEENGGPATPPATREPAAAWSSLVPIQTQGTNPPLFCIHGMNGNVLNFRDLAMRLGGNQPFYGLQAVGLNGEDEPHTRIEQMAAHYLAEIRRVQAHGPYLLAGYSGGGLIAFEMAHQVQAAGEEVALLAFIDTFCPTYVLKLSSRAERTRWFLRGVREGGVPFLSRWLWRKTRDRAERLLKRGTYAAKALPEQPDEEEQTIDLGPLFTEAQARYQLRLLDADVSLFRATERTEHGWLPRDMGWGPFIAGEVSVWEVPGEHRTMCLEPNVNVLATHLAAAIAAATKRHAVAV